MSGLKKVMKISAVILSKNDEKNIEACIKSVSFCGEIIVIDDNSTDKTRDVAQKLGAKVYEHSLYNNFSKQRNFGLEKAKGEWVLFIDSDEKVPDSLAFEITETINRPGQNYDGFYIPRKDTMWGKILQYGETGNIKLLRLGKKEVGVWHGTVHEVWEIKGNRGILKNPILHFPHPTIAEFLTEINYYTTLRAQELHEQKARASWFSVLFYTKAKFIQNYFLKFGFRDGVEGFIFALIMCFHSFLTRSKLWQLQSKSK